MEKTDREQFMMKRAFDLAIRGRGRTFPNPMVGALIVRDDVIVGEGYHHRVGGPHAEIEAIEDARGNTRGATLYVNLEPCNHHGKTPPCSEAIVRAGIKKVVCAMKDPNPKVRGKGLRRLSEENIDVTVGILSDEAERLNEVYCKNMRENLPFVALKIAQSLDGRIATYSGNSKWITGEESRKYVHMMRNEHAAVIVGVGTVLADDPLLTVRDVDIVRPPLRVVLDTHLRIPGNAKLLNSGREARTLIYTAVEDITSEQYGFLNREGVSVRTIGYRGDRLDLEAVLRDLLQQGIYSVFVEGGTQIFTSFLSEGLVDKLYIFIGPVIVGGGKSYPSFDDLGISTIEKAVGVNVFESRRLGQDTLIVCYPSAVASRMP